MAKDKEIPQFPKITFKLTPGQLRKLAPFAKEVDKGFVSGDGEDSRRYGRQSMTDKDTKPRPITDSDLVRVADENYNKGRKHGKEELADEIETLIYWLLRCYQSGHREGWEPGPSTQETMDRVLDVLANRGYDPNEDQAAKDLIAKMEKR